MRFSGGQNDRFRQFVIRTQNFGIQYKKPLGLKLNCLLTTEAACATGFYIDEIEMEILHAS